MLIFLIIFSIFFICLSLVKPKWALACVIFGLPTYLIRFRIWFMPLTLLEAMILILFAVWAIRSIGSWRLPPPWRGPAVAGKIKNCPWKWLLLAWLLVSALAIAVSPDKAAALGIWKAYFLEPILLFIVFTDIVNGKKDLNLVFGALGLSALAVSLYAIVQKFTGWGIVNPFWEAAATRRITSFFEYPNAVGLYLAPIVVLLAGYFLSPPSFLKNFGWKRAIVVCFALCVICLSVLAIVFAQSEGALAGLAGGALVLILFGIIGRAGGRIRKAAVIAFVLIVVFSAVYPFLVLKFSDPYQAVNFQNPLVGYLCQKATFRDLSGAIRQEQWRETWFMLKDGGRWLRGAGLSGYQETLKPYHQEGIFYNFDNDPDFRRKIVIFNEKYKAAHWQPVEIFLYPHNIILNFWSELGLVGLIVFILITIKFFRRGFRKITLGHSPLAISCIAAMAALLVHGLVDVPYFKNDLAVLFWLVAGLMAVAEKDKEICVSLK